MESDGITMIRPHYTNSNQITESHLSSMQLISERDNRYEAHIDCHLEEKSVISEDKLELYADPSTVRYLLEPGERGNLRSKIDGRVEVNGDKYKTEIIFGPELLERATDVFLYSNFNDAKIKALGDNTATLNMEEHPFKNISDL